MNKISSMERINMSLWNKGHLKIATSLKGLVFVSKSIKHPMAFIIFRLMNYESGLMYMRVTCSIALAILYFTLPANTSHVLSVFSSFPRTQKYIVAYVFPIPRSAAFSRLLSYFLATKLSRLYNVSL